LIVAIWFDKDSTKLSIGLTTSTNMDNEGIADSKLSLPLNATTNVRVEAVGRNVSLFLNNSFDSMVTVSADRISGEAILYAPNPWSLPAVASIGSIQMKSL
jgi:hypothetical protein